MTTIVSPVFREVKPTAQQIDEARAVFESTIAADIARNSTAQQQRAEQMSRIIHPSSLQENGTKDMKNTFHALKELEEQTAAQQLHQLRSFDAGLEAQQQFMLKMDNQLKIGGPPYDVDWTSGVIASASKATGEFSVNPMQTSASAAVGMYLSPSEDMIAKFTAYMPIAFKWTHWVAGPGFAGSSGGVGILIYDISGHFNPTDNRALLWNQTLHGGIDRQEHYTYLGNTAAAETYFLMKKNGLYLIWAWCWAENHFGGTAVSLASVNCRMPFFVVRPQWL
ncbi:hypothetical protein ECE50_009220 [Chitinophaga sp. Mgbs1]|uniref:Uncharacterized protein n=1 Tax=Chitinophaga solisilvae TaxID=1233460 RepID=A0A433WMY8_9BACT|nr:hypothetical protein [Chitinophaga solisilvae]